MIFSKADFLFGSSCLFRRLQLLCKEWNCRPCFTTDSWALSGKCWMDLHFCWFWGPRSSIVLLIVLDSVTQIHRRWVLAHDSVDLRPLRDLIEALVFSKKCFSSWAATTRRWGLSVSCWSQMVAYSHGWLCHGSCKLHRWGCTDSFYFFVCSLRWVPLVGPMIWTTSNFKEPLKAPEKTKNVTPHPNPLKFDKLLNQTKHTM